MRPDYLKLKNTKSSQAFTLIEIIIVVALIGLMGSLIVVNVDGLLRGLGDRSVDKALNFAVREARYEASARKETTSIGFDQEAGQFIVYDQNGYEIKNINFSGYEDLNQIAVNFFQILPAEGLNTTSRKEVSPITQIRFRPDRSSTPFEVEFDVSGTKWRQIYDPFSDIIVEDSR